MKSLILSVAIAMTSSVACAHQDHPKLSLPQEYHARSIDAGDNERTEALEEKLKLIAYAKSYGVQVFGLEKSPNYLKYRKPENARTMYWLFVTPKAEVPDSRNYSISIVEDGEHRTIHAGSFRLSSHVDDLLDEEEFYQGEGLDVYRREITDFYDSKGCDLTPDFLDDFIVEQAGTVFHEDWHHTFRVWNPGKILSSEINESAGVLVGYAGGVEFMAQTYGKDSKRYKNAINRFDRRKKNSSMRRELHARLTELYNSDVPEKEKFKKRHEIFTEYRLKGLRHNNASLWDDVPYDKHLGLMVKVHEKAGSVREFINVMKKCPTNEEKAVDYLEKYITFPEK